MYVFIHRGKNLRRNKAINQVDGYQVKKMPDENQAFFCYRGGARLEISA